MLRLFATPNTKPIFPDKPCCVISPASYPHFRHRKVGGLHYSLAHHVAVKFSSETCPPSESPEEFALARARFADVCARFFPQRNSLMPTKRPTFSLSFPR